MLATIVIAYARSFVGNATYVLSRHGPTEFDCVGLMDYVLDHFDLLDSLVGPTVPWKVRWYHDHWLGSRGDPGSELLGDLLIIGYADSSVDDEIYAHIGMASDRPGYYISAYNPKAGITEYPIPRSGPFRLIEVLHTGLEQSTEKDVFPINGNATLLTATGTVAPDLASIHPQLSLISPTGKADTKPTSVIYKLWYFSPNGIGPYAEPAYLVYQDGQPFYLLARNCFATLV